MASDMIRHAYKLILLLVLISVYGWVEAESSTSPFAGVWSGGATSAAEDTGLILHITGPTEALAVRMSLPDIGVSGWPAESVQAVKAGIEVIFVSDSGPQTLRLRIDGDRLEGEWREARFEEAAMVSLDLQSTAPSIIEKRIQIKGPAGTLGASVLLPTGSGPYPGIVFLHGSGPQPRDSNRFAAQSLAEQGFASVIYDKRGVGESDGSQSGATIEELAADGIAVAEYLLGLDEVSSVGFFGHSQGGWVGPHAGANWKHTAFVISSAGPAVPPSRETHWNVIRALRLSGADEAAELKARTVLELWNEGVRSGDWTAFDLALLEVRNEDWFADSGLEWFGQRPDEDSLTSYRAIMDYDPIPDLMALDAPFLAILAPDDESIDALETEHILRNMKAAGRPISLTLYAGYDHGMRRLGAEGQTLRWPEHPVDYFSGQAAFIGDAVRQRD